MIRAAIFDLDGTLVQTERLKALSYARAVAELRPGAFNEQAVVGGFRDVVGRSRDEVAVALMARFALHEAAKARERVRRQRAQAGPFTRQQFKEQDMLDRRWVVDDPDRLPDVVRQRIAAHAGAEA